MNTTPPRSLMHWYFALTLGTALLMPRIAAAEGLVHGHIIGQDAQGENAKLVPGAKIEFSGPGGRTVVSSNEDGYYEAKGLPAGTYEYRITADGYSDYDARRAFELKSGEGVHVMDFFLSQDSQETIAMGTVRGRVVQVRDGVTQPLYAATIGLRHDDGTVDVLATDKNGEYEKNVKSGRWRVSANSLGFETKFHPSPITLEAGGSATVDFSFEMKTTKIETTKEVYALVSVQQVGAPAVDRLPNVKFMAQDGAAVRPIPAEVRSLTETELADLGIPASGTWLWFEARPSGAVAAGSLHVEARLEPFDPAISETKQVDPARSTYFDVTLRHKTDEELADDAPDPTEIDPKKVAIHGHVIGQDEEGNTLGLVSGAMVEFLDENGVVVGTDKTDQNGYYFVHSLSPGDYVYRLVHPRYQKQDEGRGFSLTVDTGLLVLDFFLTQGTETEQIGSLAGTAVDQQQQPVPGTSVMVWQDDDPNSKKILPLRDTDAFKTTLSSGNWIVTATAPGYLSSPVAVTIVAGQEATADLVLKRRSDTDPSSMIEALVAVQRFDHKQGAGGTPTVKFVRTRDEQFVPAKVRRLSDAEAQAIGGGAGSWEWFVAEPAQALSADDYHVTGELEDYHPAKSSVQTVEPLGVVSYHITLRSTKEDDPEVKQQGVIHGLVQLQDRNGRKSPIAGATIALHNTTTGTEVELRSNSKGQYGRRTFEPGRWWATVHASGFATYLHPEVIALKNGGRQRVDFVFPVEDRNDKPQPTYAVVAIEKTDTGQDVGEPVVQFVNTATGAKVAAQLKSVDDEIQSQLGGSLGAGTTWQWYDAFPVSKLAPGKYRATGRLTRFRPDESQEKPVDPSISTIFSLTLRSEDIEPRPGQLIARVWKDYGGDERELASDAVVAFQNTKTGALVYATRTADGDYVADVPAGDWRASANVQSLAPAILPNPVTVLEGRQSFCELVIVVPPPPPEELPKLYALVGVELPPGRQQLGREPTVHFVPADARQWHGSEHCETWLLTLYQPFGGNDALSESSQIVGDLPSWTEENQAATPGGVSRIDADNDEVRAAAQQAVALFNRQEQQDYELCQVRFAGSQAVSGSIYHLVVELSQAGDSPDGYGGMMSADVQPLTPQLLSKLGYQPNDLPTGPWDWYLATPTEPLPPDAYYADAHLDGYDDGVTQVKSAIPGFTTIFEVTMPMQIPQVEVVVYAASPETPVGGLVAKFVNVELGRSLSDAIEVQTDASGRGEGRLADGMGTYNILLTGGDLEPQGRQVPIDQLMTTIPFNVRRPGDPLTFTGTVVKRGRTGKTEMVQETRSRTRRVTSGGVTKLVTEDYVVNVPKSSGTDFEEPVADARIVLAPSGAGTAPASLSNPIISDGNGAFRREQVPPGEYRVSISAKDCLPYDGSVTLDSDNMTKDFVLEACNKQLEDYLVKLLTEGWGRTRGQLAAANKYYRLAKREDPASASVDYAMALAMMKAKRWADAAKYATQATGSEPTESVWDRAAEAEVWLQMYRNEVRSAVTSVRKIGTGVYPQREPTAASPETAYVLGITTGVLLGPWQKKHPQSGAEQADAALTASLTSPHLQEYERGRDEILSKHKDLAGQLDQAQANAKADADAKRNKQQQVINDRIKRIDAELAEISREIDRARAQAEAICQQSEIQIARVRPQLQQISGNLTRLYQERDRIQRLLIDARRRLQSFDRDRDDGGGPRFLKDPVRPPAGPPVGYLTNPLFAQMQTQGPRDGIGQQQTRGNSALLEQIRQYERDLLLIGRRIAMTERTRAQYADTISRYDAECQRAQNQYQSMYQSLLQRTQRLRRSRQRFLNSLGSLNSAGPIKSDESDELEDSIGDFLTYRKFKLEARRTELLRNVQTCDGDQAPPALY